MKHRKPITTAGMYASMIGTNHAVTGPIASSISERQGSEAHTENATQATVANAANVNRSVGRTPKAGRVRAVNPPNPSACARTALTPRSYPGSRSRRFAATAPQMHVGYPADGVSGGSSLW